MDPDTSEEGLTATLDGYNVQVGRFETLHIIVVGLQKDQMQVFRRVSVSHSVTHSLAV